MRLREVTVGHPCGKIILSLAFSFLPIPIPHTSVNAFLEEFRKRGGCSE